MNVAWRVEGGNIAQDRQCMGKCEGTVPRASQRWVPLSAVSRGGPGSNTSCLGRP